MFLQVLYAVVKGLLEMDGYVVTPTTNQAPATNKPIEPAACENASKTGH